MQQWLHAWSTASGRLATIEMRCAQAGMRRSYAVCWPPLACTAESFSLCDKSSSTARRSTRTCTCCSSGLAHEGALARAPWPTGRQRPCSRWSLALRTAVCPASRRRLSESRGAVTSTFCGASAVRAVWHCWGGEARMSARHERGWARRAKGRAPSRAWSHHCSEVAAVPF
jgi:hypothetical protein